ncbi:MAG TPA: XisH family protein [Gemmataceae bacterium]|jgi:hypothetical protein
MPARDLHHDVVRRALVKDGWVITHDPFRLVWGAEAVYMDLGAELFVTAEKQGRRIGVEIKSMAGRSPITEFERALGQYLIYRAVTNRLEPDRRLYLAVPTPRYYRVIDTELGRLVSDEYRVNYVLYNSRREVIDRWIDSTNSGP